MPRVHVWPAPGEGGSGGSAGLDSLAARRGGPAAGLQVRVPQAPRMQHHPSRLSGEGSLTREREALLGSGSGVHATSEGEAWGTLSVAATHGVVILVVVQSSIGGQSITVPLVSDCRCCHRHHGGVVVPCGFLLLDPTAPWWGSLPGPP